MVQAAAPAISLRPAHLDHQLAIRAQSQADLLRRTRLGAARDLLGALGTATIPGQHYLMDKVIALLDEEVFRSGGRLTAWQRQTIARSTNEMQREAARLAPDESAFARRAEILMDVLFLM